VERAHRDGWRRMGSGCGGERGGGESKIKKKIKVV
jgi:hypothetical protein